MKLRLFANFILLIAILGLASSASAASKCTKLISTVVHVDPYSSGRFLPDAVNEFFKKSNIEVQNIYIHSDKKPPGFTASTFMPENFKTGYSYDGKLNKLIEWLKEFNIKAIMAGSEGGVLLANLLSEKLSSTYQIGANKYSEAFRNKYEMNEALKQSGVDTAFQMQSKNYNEVLAWINKNNLWPGTVVLKPPMSAGTDGVSFCRNEIELKAAFDKIIKKKNEFGKDNEFVLAQEYLDGIEYVVNSASAYGHHVITDIWQYNKKNVDGAAAMYEHDRLLPFEGDVQKQLVEYHLKVLNGLGIKNGWGHAEIKMTKRGPVLVEIGNRMMGSGQPRLTAEALGHGQIDLGVMAALVPNEFKKIQSGYKIQKHASMVNINSDYDGKTMSYKIVPQLIQLASYKRHQFFFDANSVAPRSVDMNTTLGQIELLHQDPKILEQDISTIKQWEKDGLFFK